MRRSKMLAKLRAGKVALVVNISLSPSPLAVEMAGRAGVDGVWIDTEHRPFTPREVAHVIAGARLGDVDAIVRIRKGEGYTSFFRPFEDGAAGIIVPHVKTREEAEWVVSNAKYPPLGRRGVENVMPDADLGYADSLAYLEHANRETFVIVQIEDAEALDALDDILSVDGIEMVFIGPADLSCSMGIPFQFDRAEFRDAVRRIADSAKRNGVWWGLPVLEMAAGVPYVEMGARFLNVGGDYRFLRAAFETARRTFDETFSSLV